MTKTVVGLFDSLNEAQNVVKDLTNAGFRREDVSLLANDAGNQYGTYLDKGAVETEDAVGPAEGAGFGAVVGALTGILAGLTALVIPGVGPVIAAGPIIGGVTGLVAGAATGGIVAALVKTGIPEEEAQYYAEIVRRGGTLVSVTTPDADAARARQIIERHNPVNVQERVTGWQRSGWKGFDPNAAPYTATTTDRTRTAVAGESVPTAVEIEEVVIARDVAANRRGKGKAAASTASDWHVYDTDFRNNFNQNYANSGYTYDEFTPVYRYGYGIANDPEFSGDWSTVEPEARRRWEERNPNTWDEFKAAVRYAWDKVRGKDTTAAV